MRLQFILQRKQQGSSLSPHRNPLMYKAVEVPEQEAILKVFSVKLYDRLKIASHAIRRVPSANLLYSQSFTFASRLPIFCHIASCMRINSVCVCIFSNSARRKRRIKKSRIKSYHGFRGVVPGIEAASIPGVSRANYSVREYFAPVI